MADKKNTVRKTVSLDQELVDQCGMLFASAGADNFSEYVSMALKKYNDILISETQSSLLTNEMRGAIRKELGPITSRLSRGLYRYGVLIDMLCQMLSYMQFGGGDEIMNHFISGPTQEWAGHAEILICKASWMIHGKQSRNRKMNNSFFDWR